MKNILLIFVRAINFLLLIVLSIVTINATDIKNMNPSIFSLGELQDELVLGSIYNYEINVNDNIKNCEIVIKYNPLSIKFLNYTINDEFAVRNYNDDSVLGELSIRLEKVSKNFEDNLLVDFNFKAIGINSGTIAIDSIYYSYDGETTLTQELEEYNYVVVDLYDYSNFIAAVNAINNDDLLSEYDNIKKAMLEMEAFDKDVVSTELAKKAVKTLEQYIIEYNEIIALIEKVSSDASIVGNKVGGK